MALDYPEEHRREALLITLGIHALLALLFFFVVFRGPDPPLTDFGGSGVELNYGIDEAGSGDIQSTAPANKSPNRADSRPPAQSPDPQPRPVAAVRAPTPPAEEKIITSDAEQSPVTAPPVDQTPAPPKEEVKETPRPPRKVAVTFTPKGSADGGGNGVNGTSSAPTGNNNGDRPGSTGDQGDPRGTLDGNSLYGNPGHGGPGRGGSGGALEMSGWAPESVPSVKPVDDNSGIIRFKIKINEDGDVESVTKVSGSVSPAQEQLCRDALTNATFRRTNSGVGGATGFYTFRITVR